MPRDKVHDELESPVEQPVEVKGDEVIQPARNTAVHEDKKAALIKPKSKSPMEKAIVSLDQASLNYKHHLENELVRLLKKENPKKESLKTATREAILTGIVAPWDVHSEFKVPYSRWSAEFSEVKRKYDVVLAARTALTTGTDDKKKVEGFMVTINKNKTVLEQHRDSATKRFFAAIGHILTAGIVSKISKGSFSFWKSHGKVFAEDVSNIANKALKR